jgi:hypothetical protein
MPYVPGFEQDVFISYASEDRTWVLEFQNKLTDALMERGLDAEFWRDADNIRFGQNWKEEMFKALERAALFLAILSPNYRQSDFCNDESDYFQKLRETGGDMKVSSQALYRYLKIVKMAWDDDAHKGLLPELQEIEFFARDARKKLDLPIAFTSKEFETRIRLTAHAIEATLKGLRRLREMVYVASPADDVDGDWRRLRAELQHQGYVVGPVAKLNRGMAPDFIRKEFKGALLSIHLLGSEYHPLAERQLDLCAEAGQKMAVWIRKGADETAGEQQRMLLKAVRDFDRIPKGTPVIEGSVGRTPVNDLLELLKPVPTKASTGDTSAGGPTIYLICDPSVDEDRDFAFELERIIEEREGMHVVVPQRDAAGAHARHQKMLLDCDGVLLYREKAPENWFFQYFADVARAEKLLKREPIVSKAILAPDGDFSDLPCPPSVRLIGRTHPFSFDALDPFLAPLRGTKGAAHAG